jgi:hypothetical protein
MMGRMVARNIKPRLVITEKDGKWTLRTETTLKTMIIEFTVNVEFEETTGDGRELKVTAHDCTNKFNSCVVFFRGSLSLKAVNGFKKCMTRMVKSR